MKTEIDLLGTHFDMAPRKHRRWFVVLIYLISSLWIVNFSMGATLVGPRVGFMLAVLGFLALLAFHLYAGTGYEGGDERQTHRRDHAFYVAHRQLNWVLVCALFAVSLQGPTSPIRLITNSSQQKVLDQVPFVAIFVLLLLYSTLPQAVLLWTEPDMERD